MIPQGRQCQEAALAAAEKSHGCCGTQHHAESSHSPKRSTQERGRKEASSRGNAADSGREGNSFAGKTNHQASQNPNNCPCILQGGFAERWEETNRRMHGWKHHLKITFQSGMSGQSVSEGDRVLTFGFSITSLPPSSVLQLRSTLTEASPERG